MAKILLDDQSPLSATNVEGLVLYNSAASPCVRRCRIALLEKGLDYDTVEMDLPNMEQRREEYLSLNPNGYVPTLSHGAQVIFDSGAINEYLDEQFPQTPLLPESAKDRAQVRMWIGSEETMSKDFRPLLYQRVMGPITHITRSLDEARLINGRCTRDPLDMAWGDRVWNMQILTAQQEVQQERKLMQWLDSVEAGLMNKHYLVAEQFTLADISVFPRVVMFSYLGLEITPSRFPNVLKWIERLEKRPSFEASMSEQAKKLRKMATSPLMPKLRGILNQQKSERGVLDNFFVWGLGRVMRKIQKIDQVLLAVATPRTLPMPKQALLPVKFHSNSKPQFVENTKALTLWGSEISPHSARIVKLMNFLGLAYTYQEIDLKNGEQKTNTFKNLNPLAEVPVLQHGDMIIHDSRAIAEYLIERFDHQQLWWGSDSLHGAQNRMWLALEAGTYKEIKPLFNKYMMHQKHSPLSAVDEQSALQRIEQKLQVLEKALENSEFLCGESIRYADIAWYTRLEMLINIPGFIIKPSSNIYDWYTSMAKVMAKDSYQVFKN